MENSNLKPEVHYSSAAERLRDLLIEGLFFIVAFGFILVMLTVFSGIPGWMRTLLLILPFGIKSILNKLFGDFRFSTKARLKEDYGDRGTQVTEPVSNVPPEASPIKSKPSPPMLMNLTQEIIHNLQEKLGGPVICYWNSNGGQVCSNDVNALSILLERLGKQETIYLFVKSYGGSGEAAMRMIHLLRHFSDKVVALIPFECASAGTMLALGANEIRMAPSAYLTAVDTSIHHDLSPVNQNNYSVSVSLNELSRVTKLWESESKRNNSQGNPYQSLYTFIHPLVIGAADRASSLSTKLCEEILSYHLEDREKALNISKSLNSDYPSHSFPITLREAKRIGLNAVELNPDQNALLVQLHGIYSKLCHQFIVDRDHENYHENQVKSVLEVENLQIFFQTEKDWHYRSEEKRWIPMNDLSAWKRAELNQESVEVSQIYFN